MTDFPASASGAPYPVPTVVIEPKGGPSATLRDLTERSVTPEANSERLDGVKVEAVLRATNVVLAPAPLRKPGRVTRTAMSPQR
jgi:hypothetical protein